MPLVFNGFSDVDFFLSVKLEPSVCKLGIDRNVFGKLFVKLGAYRIFVGRRVFRVYPVKKIVVCSLADFRAVNLDGGILSAGAKQQ